MRTSETGSTSTRPPSRLSRALSQWPLALGLTLLWGALWQDLSPRTLVPGLVYALIVMTVFPMPRIPFSDRISPWWSLVFLARFLWDVVTASVHVAAVILTHGSRVHSSVVAVPLRTDDDLITTLTGHALALVPGSIVIEVDRTGGTLYLHCLDATSEADVEQARASARRVEAGLIRAVGTREDLRALRAEGAERGSEPRRTTERTA